MKQDLVAFNLALKGKTIKKVGIMSKETAEMYGWYKLPWIIQFTDDTIMYAQSDDEGNDAGVINYIGKKAEDDLLLYNYSSEHSERLQKEMRNDK